jgi:hypothetical protein
MRLCEKHLHQFGAVGKLYLSRHVFCKKIRNTFIIDVMVPNKIAFSCIRNVGDLNSYMLKDISLTWKLKMNR